MRLRVLVCVTCALLSAGEAFGQEWIEYVSREGLFTINFPRPPEVQAFSYETEYGAKVPARVHRVTDGASRYAVTAVD